MKAAAELYLRCLTEALPVIVKTAIVDNPELTLKAIKEIKNLISDETLTKVASDYEDTIYVAAEAVQGFLESRDSGETQTNIPVC